MKIFKICFIICALFVSNNNDIAFAEIQEKNVYAKALENCVLYKNKNLQNSMDEILFIIPETYFVTILDEIDEGSCYMVQYDKYIGYVSASSVIIAEFTPIVKTLNGVTFDIKSTSGTQIWSKPSTDSDIYTTISAGTKNISYIASVKGSIPNGGESNVWYYVQYTPSGNSTNFYEGYIYSENTINLTDIVSNNEVNPEVIAEENNNDKVIYISSTFKTIIVTLIAIPVILFFCIILYKLTKKFKKTTNNSKNSNNINIEQSGDFVESKKLNLLDKFKNMIRLKRNNNEGIVDLQDDELL